MNTRSATSRSAARRVSAASAAAALVLSGAAVGTVAAPAAGAQEAGSSIPGSGSAGSGSAGSGSAGSLSDPRAATVPGLLTPAENRLIVTGGSPTGTCFGAVSATIDPDDEIGTAPGSVGIEWGVAMPGVGDCDLVATVSWRNLDTGRTGEKIVTIDQPQIWGGVPNSKDSWITTDPGRVEYRLTTSAGAETGPIEVVTRASDEG